MTTHDLVGDDHTPPAAPEPGSWPPPALPPTEEHPPAFTGQRPWPATGQATSPVPPPHENQPIPTASKPEFKPQFRWPDDPNTSAPTAHIASPPAAPGAFIPDAAIRSTTPPPSSGLAPPNPAQAPARSERNDDETAWSPTSAAKTRPTQGWRGGLAKIGIKLSKSESELKYDRDIHRIRRKLAYPQNVVVVSLKGGVGKSTATIALGSTLSENRHLSDVVAFDSATDGSLRRRMPEEQNQAVTSDTRHFLRSIEGRRLTGSEIQVQLYSNPAGLQTLAGHDNIKDYTLDVDEFHRILAALHAEYMVNLIDTGPDRRVPTFWPAIQAAHAIVLVTTPSALSIANTKRFIDLLRESECNHLLARTVLLWNNAAPGKDIAINVDATKSYLVRQLSTQNDPSQCMVDIPLDAHLATAGEIYLSSLDKHTRRQFERAAALLMDKLPDRAVQR